MHCNVNNTRSLCLPGSSVASLTLMEVLTVDAVDNIFSSGKVCLCVLCVQASVSVTHWVTMCVQCVSPCDKVCQCSTLLRAPLTVASCWWLLRPAVTTHGLETVTWQSRDSQATPPPLPSSRGYNGQLFGNISNFHAILIKAILSHNWKYNMLYCYMLYWLESIFLLQFLLPRQKQTYDLSYLKSLFYII